MTKKKPESLDPDEINRVARGLAEGHVFTAAHCPPDMIASVFMVVGMGGLSTYDLDHVGMVYEWMDKRGHYGVNGLPCFMSCKVLNTDDWSTVARKAESIEQAIAEALQ